MRDTVLEQYLAKMGFLRDDYIEFCDKKPCMNSAVFKKNHYFCMSIKKWSKGRRRNKFIPRSNPLNHL